VFVCVNVNVIHRYIVKVCKTKKINIKKTKNLKIELNTDVYTYNIFYFIDQIHNSLTHFNLMEYSFWHFHAE
jgi:hypothetical protein